jgi:hypothetical protein
MASAEYGAMSLAFGLDPKNASEHSRPSSSALQYTRKTFGYTSNLADRRRFIAAINELAAIFGNSANLKLTARN